MTNREYFIKRWQEELPVFVKVLQAVNESNWDYQPDPKSKTGKQLVHLFVNEVNMFTAIAQGVKMDMSAPMPKAPEGSLDELVAMFEQGAETYTKALQAMSEDTWENSKTGFYMGEKAIWETTMMDMLWMLAFDMVHHRGQLSTYLRAMGGKVPSIYGPSADDKGPMADMM